VDDRRRDRLWRLVTGRAGSHSGAGWAGVVVEVAVAEIEVDAATITVRTAARAQDVLAATDDWALRLEELQYTVGDGPGVQAYRTGGPVLISDLLVGESRWPGFADVVAEVGAAAAFAFPLQAGGIRLGTLALYRRRPGALGPDELADAAILADLATTALLTDIAAQSPDAEPAVGRYDDVNIATGMLAVQLKVSVEDAFLRLRAHAFSRRRPLLDVARDVLERRLRLDSFGE
jgi:hypothetical protein